MTRFATLAIVAAASWLAFGSLASAEDGPRAIDENHAGYPLYIQYCASCHGVFADGLGPAVPALRSRPPDLSRLAAKYGRPLPKAVLARFIDGQEMVRGHGSSDMPVWGTKLRRELPPATTPSIQRRTLIQSIVDYLAAIQRSDDAP